jgi:A/G-specific adenine glycosylase
MIERFAERLADWQKRHGRHDLPWQQRGPYETWISEIMLQQTQVQVVIPYFNRFVASFPSEEVLAAAPIDDVLAHWAGLGYYSRARNLHRAAQVIMQEHQGSLPNDLDALIALPGIGRSTAGAIVSLGFGARGVIQDGNVRRVLSRVFCISGDLSKSNAQNQLWDLADTLTPDGGADQKYMRRR